MATRDEYVNQIKDAFVTVGEKAAMGYIVAQLPLLGSPILKPFTQFLVKLTLKGIANDVETAAFFAYIDMRVGAQGKNFEVAAQYNSLMQKTGTPEEKKRAEEMLRKELRKFIALTM